jgi:hypothetical protein
LLGIGIRKKSSPNQKVSPTFLTQSITLNLLRREMIKTTLFMMCTCIETILSHSYISVTSLLMYGTMWSLDMRFDTRLFTISYILLTYTHQSSVSYFNFAIRDLFNYMAAEKRIRVSLNRFFNCSVEGEISSSIGFSFTWWIGTRQSIVIQLIQRFDKDGYKWSESN